MPPNLKGIHSQNATAPSQTEALSLERVRIHNGLASI